eukprot:scaffold52663_cov76-Cyclotella_meneghiniana.AAC.4
MSGNARSDRRLSEDVVLIMCIVGGVGADVELWRMSWFVEVGVHVPLVGSSSEVHGGMMEARGRARAREP